MTGVCDFYILAFGIKTQVMKSGLPLLREYLYHPNQRTLFAQGYQIVNLYNERDCHNK